MEQVERDLEDAVIDEVVGESAEAVLLGDQFSWDDDMDSAPEVDTCFRGPFQSMACTSPVLFFYSIQIQYNSQAVTAFDSLVKKFNGARGKR